MIVSCWLFNKFKFGIVIFLVFGIFFILFGIIIGNVFLSDIILFDWEVDFIWKLVKFGFWIIGCLEELVLINVDLIIEEWFLIVFFKFILEFNFWFCIFLNLFKIFINFFWLIGLVI